VLTGVRLAAGTAAGRGLRVQVQATQIDWPYTVYRIRIRAGSFIGGCLPTLASGRGDGTIRLGRAIGGARTEP
jgi:hypothetical protein